MVRAAREPEENLKRILIYRLLAPNMQSNHNKNQKPQSLTSAASSPIAIHCKSGVCMRSGHLPVVTRERDSYGITFAITVHCAMPLGALSVWRRLCRLPGVTPTFVPSLLRWRAHFDFLGKPYLAVALKGRVWIGAQAPVEIYRETEALYELLRQEFGEIKARRPA